MDLLKAADRDDHAADGEDKPDSADQIGPTGAQTGGTPRVRHERDFDVLNPFQEGRQALFGLGAGHLLGNNVLVCTTELVDGVKPFLGGALGLRHGLLSGGKCGLDGFFRCDQRNLHRRVLRDEPLFVAGIVGFEQVAEVDVKGVHGPTGDVLLCFSAHTNRVSTTQSICDNAERSY